MTLVNLTRAEVEAAVEAAIAAPSVLNLQPWRFAWRDNAIWLHIDRSRRLPTLDPQDRELSISCGSALFNLRIALESLGYLVQVDITPSTDPDLLAIATAVRTRGVGAATRALAEAIPRRRTSRFPFTRSDVPTAVRDRLVSAAEAEGAYLRFPANGAYDDLSVVLRDADRQLHRDRSARAELAQWVGVASSHGLPPEVLGPRPRDPASTMRDFAPAFSSSRDVAVFEKEPMLAVLSTRGDEVEDWLVAGQALEHVWLRATIAGLSCSLNSSAMEVAALRWLARDPTGPLAIPQIVIRVGNGSQDPPRTPRRPTREVLSVDR